MTSPGILAVLRVTFPRLHATHEWAGTLEYIALHNKVKADFCIAPWYYDPTRPHLGRGST
jgi:hypothetical protein